MNNPKLTSKKSVVEPVPIDDTKLAELQDKPDLTKKPVIKEKDIFVRKERVASNYKRNQAAYMQAHSKVKKSIPSPLDN